MNKILSLTIAIVAIVGLSSCSRSWSEVEGTVTDKYIEEGGSSTRYDPDGVLTVDANDVKYKWHVNEDEFANCEIGDAIRRNESGNVTCEAAVG